MSSSRPGLPTGTSLSFSFPFPFLAVVAASAARTCSKQSSVEKICVPRFPTVIPARFRFRASLASLSPWFSLSKTVFLAFTASTAVTSEVMRFLTGVGSDGLQDCRNSMFSLVNEASGVLGSGPTGVGVEGTVMRTRCGLKGCRPVAFHPTVYCAPSSL